MIFTGFISPNNSSYLFFLGSHSDSVCVFEGVGVYQSVMNGVRVIEPGVMLSDYHMSECSRFRENLSVSMWIWVKCVREARWRRWKGDVVIVCDRFRNKLV